MHGRSIKIPGNRGIIRISGVYSAVQYSLWGLCPGPGHQGPIIRIQHLPGPGQRSKVKSEWQQPPLLFPYSPPFSDHGNILIPWVRLSLDGGVGWVG